MYTRGRVSCQLTLLKIVGNLGLATEVWIVLLYARS